MSVSLAIRRQTQTPYAFSPFCAFLHALLTYLHTHSFSVLVMNCLLNVLVSNVFTVPCTACPGNSVVSFSLSKSFFCRCYKSGATETIITCYMFYIRSLAVAPFR